MRHQSCAIQSRASHHNVSVMIIKGVNNNSEQNTMFQVLQESWHTTHLAALAVFTWFSVICYATIANTIVINIPSITNTKVVQFVNITERSVGNVGGTEDATEDDSGANKQIHQDYLGNNPQHQHGDSCACNIGAV